MKILIAIFLFSVMLVNEIAYGVNTFVDQQVTIIESITEGQTEHETQDQSEEDDKLQYLESSLVDINSTIPTQGRIIYAIKSPRSCKLAIISPPPELQLL